MAVSTSGAEYGPVPAQDAELVRVVALAFVAHDFPHGSPEHYARIALEVLEAERPWPGFCQACKAPLDPPDLTWCPTCGASDDDE